LKTAYVLDTNVLLFDPTAVNKFGNNEVVIPIVVIEEMDRVKREMSENGRHARQFSRYIDKLRAKGALSEGVKLENGGTITVEMGSGIPLPGDLEMDKADNRIIGVAMALKKDQPRRPVVMVTKDANLRIKSDALGIKAADFDPTPGDSSEDVYTGGTQVMVSSHQVDEFFSQKRLPVDKAFYKNSGLKDTEFHPNEYVLLKDNANPTHTGLARYSQELESLVPIIKAPEGVWGIFPKNAEQSFAIDALLNDDVKLVSMIGRAGTGKTLLAIAAGLAKTVDDGIYHRLLISRPVFPLGRDIGYLPGDMEEKMNPWMQPFYDNIDFLFGATGSKGRRGAGKGTQELINQGLLQVEPLTYIRGRTLPQQFLIVDEAQNLTPHEIKTIVTRVGDDSKIVLTGDHLQIDNPYVDSANNGLVYVAERFKREQISAHVLLVKGERSKLADLATKLL